METNNVVTARPDILERAMNGFMGCCDCDGNKAAFRECGMEISRLRYEVTRLEAEIARLAASEQSLFDKCADQQNEINRLRLTDAERKALETAVRMAGDPSPITAPQVFEYAATLRDLLERTK